MDTILEYCKGAERISINTKNVGGLKDLNIKIDLKNDEIFRSRYYNDDSCIFNLELRLKKGDDINEEISYMKTIEMFYPNIFSWRFNGKHIECIAKIPMKKEHLGIFGRYKSMYIFIRLLRDRLLEILKYRDYEGVGTSKFIQDMIISTGSISNRTELYVVDIDPASNIMTILNKAKHRIINNITLKELDMKFWVREINPDYFKDFSQRTELQKKYPLTPKTFNQYPPCIKKICELKKKGNYPRFLLATFLLDVHYERDAKYQLDTMLSDDERLHMKNGNCKDQWRAIVVKKYSSPSCKKMIEHGYCHKDCKRPRPVELEVLE